MEVSSYPAHNYTTVSQLICENLKMNNKKKNQKIENFKKKLDEYLRTIPDTPRTSLQFTPATNLKVGYFVAFAHNSLVQNYPLCGII